MKSRRPWVVLALAGLVTGASAVVLAAGGASGATATVSSVITGDPNAQGTIAFFDKAGDQIYSGPLSHIADYAVASSATSRTGTTKASLTFATPDHTQVDSQTYFTGGTTAGSRWSPTIVPPAALGGTVPASVTAAAGPGVPVVAIAPTDGDVGGAWTNGVDDTTAGFDHIIQVRLGDAGPGFPGQVAPFWQADVYIDTAAGTWTQLYPVPPVVTSSPSTTAPTSAAPSSSASSTSAAPSSSASTTAAATTSSSTTSPAPTTSTSTTSASTTSASTTSASTTSASTTSASTTSASSTAASLSPAAATTTPAEVTTTPAAASSSPAVAVNPPSATSPSTHATTTAPAVASASTSTDPSGAVDAADATKASGGGSTLASTGSDVLLALVLGVVLIGGGMATAAAARRRG